MKVSHKGSISLPNLWLYDTYHVLKLNFNLISMGQLCDFRYTVTFSSTGCYVQDSQTGQTIGTGCKIGRLFELISLHTPPTTSPDICAVSPSICGINALVIALFEIYSNSYLEGC
jgi:hypothetical protein